MDLDFCPRCQTRVSVYVPDCPNCGYFIWGDDGEYDSLGLGQGLGGRVFESEEDYEDYLDYDDGDFDDELDDDDDFDDDD
ncbi:MAG: hypothetical protein FWH07_06675 [Oscillospiraceae bacterium]|nr:hypothetical protein [Oscillospiraceae bacterium]